MARNVNLLNISDYGYEELHELNLAAKKKGSKFKSIDSAQLVHWWLWNRYQRKQVTFSIRELRSWAKEKLDIAEQTINNAMYKLLREKKIDYDVPVRYRAEAILYEVADPSDEAARCKRTRRRKQGCKLHNKT